MFALVDGFDNGYSITNATGTVLDRKPDLAMYADSQSIYGLSISFADTA